MKHPVDSHNGLFKFAKRKRVMTPYIEKLDCMHYVVHRA
jgi:hypothetical protein